MLGVFTDQAYNLVLLAADEARMLGCEDVEPEHLLLALARRGNVESLLAERGINASDIHQAIVEERGLGPNLVLGELPRSPAANDALERAVDAAAQRGVLGPSSEHVLLGLGQDDRPTALLRRLGIDDVEQLVDTRYRARRAALSVEQVKSYALRIGTTRSPPSPGPIPPVFERFTVQARSTIAAAEQKATALEHEYVAPFHLLLGLLGTEGGLGNQVLRRHDIDADDSTNRARLHGPRRADQSTGIFTDSARDIVARSALKHSYRHGHAAIGTGHVLLATLDAGDRVVSAILGHGPLAERIAADVVRELPGDEDL